MTYSLDFRQKVLSVKESENLTFEAAASRFCIGKNTLYLWSKEVRPKQGKSRPDIKLDKSKLLQDIKDRPDAY